MEDSGGIAVIYVPADVDPETAFAGRALLDRAVCLARAAGLSPYVVGVVGDDRIAAGVPRLRAGGMLPVELPDRARVALWRCDVAWVAGVLRRLLARSGTGRAVVLDDRGRPAIVHVAAARLAGRVPATLELAAAGCPGVGAPGEYEGNRLIALSAPRRTALRDLRTASAEASAGMSVGRAEAELVDSLDNPRDGIFDRLLNRHLSRRITPLLLRWPITPNQVTVLSLVVGFLAACALAMPGTLVPVAGALLLQLTAVLDCIDGEIARAKVLESEWGELLDITADSVIHVLVFLGMAVHAWPELGPSLAPALGGLFAVGGFASFAVVTRAERSEERWRPLGTWQARLLAQLLATLTTRDLSVLVLAAAATGMLTSLLVGAAFGAHAFWVVALVLHTGLMRAATREATSEVPVLAAPPAGAERRAR